MHGLSLVRHKYIVWIAALLSLATAAHVFFLTITQKNYITFRFHWRWYSLGVILALICNIILLVLIARATAKKQSMYWFMMFIISSCVWLAFLTLMSLSADPVSAAHW